ETSPPLLYPLISCGPSMDPMTLGCLAKDFLPDSIKFSWADKTNNSINTGLKSFKPVLQTSGTFTASSQINVESASWNRRDPFYCSAKHVETTKTVELKKKENKPPVISIHSPSKDAINGNETLSIICLCTGFTPKDITIKWLKNGKQTDTGVRTEDPVSGKNGDYDVTSFISITRKEWDLDTMYSCVVSHESTGFHQSKNMSKILMCDTVVPSNLQVITIPPSFESIFESKSAKLTCLVSNMGNSEDLRSISWYKISGEKEISLTTTIGDPLYNDNRTYSVEGTATVCADEWNQDNFICKVEHTELASVKEVPLSKRKGDNLMTPSVYVFPPHHEELPLKEKATITCLVKGFNPPDIFVKWLHNNTEVFQNQYRNTNTIEEISSKERKTFFLYSMLTIESKIWEEGGSFTCVVGHESLPLQLTQKTIDKFSARGLFIDEEEEIASLWTTASTFIVLFLLSLFYSATITLFKVSKQRSMLIIQC
ncbi:hypothetical protein GDO86_001588, partial [Hymenochirus boettgeri]